MFPPSVRFQGIYKLFLKNRPDPEGKTANVEEIETIRQILTAENPETDLIWEADIGYHVFRNDIYGDHYTPTQRLNKAEEEALQAYQEAAEKNGTDPFSFSCRILGIPPHQELSEVDDQAFQAVLPFYKAYEKAAEDGYEVRYDMVKAGPVNKLWITLPNESPSASPGEN